MKIYEDISRTDLVAEIRRITEEVLIPLAEAKGHDYAGQADETDALANVGQDLGWPGAFFRGRDKDQRLRTFLTQRELKVEDDSVENCFVDRLLYAYFAYILWMRRNCDTFIEFEELDDFEIVWETPRGADHKVDWTNCKATGITDKAEYDRVFKKMGKK